MKLISMTSFVLENAKQPYVEGTKYKDLVNYAKFLKQPLELEMFVPCDEEGNILEEPKKTDYQVDVNTKCSGWKYLYDSNDKLIGYYDDRKWKEDFVNYKQAKEKVLFVFKYHFDISVIKHHILQDRDIEYLAKFGELELTENAIKQIGL